METLKKDPLIRETGARLFLGMGTGDAFRKTQMEVSYTDAHEVKPVSYTHLKDFHQGNFHCIFSELSSTYCNNNHNI